MQIDVNGNVGESYGQWSNGDDAPILEIASTVAIACGFHAGDPSRMRTLCEGAVESGQRIAGLVGYRDLLGAGKRFMEVSTPDLIAEIIYQLGALDGVALSVGGNMTAVRLAGALATSSAQHAEQAQAIVSALEAYDPSLELLVPYNGPFAALAETRNLNVVREADASQASGLNNAISLARAGSIGSIHIGPETAGEVRKAFESAGIDITG